MSKRSGVFSLEIPRIIEGSEWRRVGVGYIRCFSEVFLGCREDASRWLDGADNFI